MNQVNYKFVVQYIISLKVININALDPESRTPLHIASQNRFADIFKYLLSIPGINVSIKGNFNNLTFDFIFWNTDIANLLLPQKDMIINLFCIIHAKLVTLNFPNCLYQNTT